MGWVFLFLLGLLLLFIFMADIWKINSGGICLIKMKKEVRNILGLVTALVLTMTLVYAIPLIDFVSPSPDSNAVTTNTSVEINLSIDEGSLGSLIYNWNGTNFTMYNSSLLLMFNFENLSSLGENNTNIVSAGQYSKNLSCTSCPVLNQSGKYGKAYTFNGTNNALTLSSAGLNFQANHKYTIEFWILPVSSAGLSAMGLAHHSATYGTYGMDINRNADGTMSLAMRQGGGGDWFSVSSTTTTSLNNWNHVAFVCDGTTITPYINGRSNAAASLGSFSSYRMYDDFIIVGVSSWMSGYFNGSIDEIMIWNRTLSSSEIYEQYVSNLQKLNQTQWNFYVNQSKNATAGLDIGNYTYQIFASNISGNLNSTEQRNISVQAGPSPKINLDWIYPTGNINVTQLEWFNVTVNVSCSNANCGNINVTLDPAASETQEFCGFDYGGGNCAFTSDLCTDGYDTTFYNTGQTRDYGNATIRVFNTTSSINSVTFKVYQTCNTPTVTFRLNGNIIGNGTGNSDCVCGPTPYPHIYNITNQTLLNMYWIPNANNSFNITMTNGPAFAGFKVIVNYTTGSVKGGTISMNANSTPFYTNVTNPFNLSLNENESRVITWWVNATGTTPNVPYEFYVYANMTSNSSVGNITSKLNITIKDLAAPTINITYPLNTTYGAIIFPTLNYTYYDYTGGGYCWYSNSSLWNSSSVVNGTNFNNIVILEGTNILTVYCNDSSGNINSANVSFTKKTPQIGLQLISPTGNININQSELFNVTVNVSCSNNNCGELNITLDPEGTVYNFTTCGATGNAGPSQAQCNANYTGTSLAGLVGVTSGIQNWTVPATGTYSIEVGGARGGTAATSGTNRAGGFGAKMKGDFYLTQGTVLQILVGQAGGSHDTYGGGGGSFVANGSNYSVASPLIVAGGGGGAGLTGTDLSNATSNTSGLAGSGSGAGGTNGGAGISDASYGGGGGGFYNSSITNGASGFRQGGAGATQRTGGMPGFGGGGSAHGGAGGAGGYSGGGGATYSSSANYGYGGGGGSYNSGTNQVNTSAAISGRGYVTITYSNGKGGTVSMDSSATPFFTTTTNPYNLSLNEGDSQIITWTVNATGTSNSTYAFFVYANLTSNSSVGNITDLWNVTIINGTSNDTSPVITDETYPVFSNYSDNNGTLNNSGIGLFNATIENTNGTVFLEINNTNITATNVSNVYNANYSFTSNGTYNYKWHSWGNGTDHNYNVSETRNYVVNYLDTIYPIFSNYSDNNASLTGSGIGLFNVTLTNTNGTVWLSINGTNYSATNVSNVYNVSVNLTSSGNYNYTWYAYGNGLNNLLNVSGTRNYIVNTSPTNAFVNLDWVYPTENINVTQLEWFNVTVNVSCSNADCGNINVTLDPTGSVYVLRGGDNDCTDNVKPILESAGYSVTCGEQEATYNGTPALSQYNLVVLLDGTSYSNAMPQSGQNEIISYVNNGGGLVIFEWAAYENGNYIANYNFSIITRTSGINSGDTYTKNGTHQITDNMPASWSVPTCGFGVGIVRGGSTEIVHGIYSQTAVAVKEVGEGRIVQFALAPGYWNQNCWGGNNTNISQLFKNSAAWASGIGGKGGIVPMTIGATPFYTNVTNPYNLSLNDGESQIITWWVNATGTTPNIPYEFYVYANLTSNSSVGNITSKLNITIKDLAAPTINITYPLNTNYNINISSINYTYYDYTGGGYCWYSNSSGVWNSSSVIAGINFTNVNSVDNSNTWTVYCNDSSGNINSANVSFEKIIPKIGLELIYPTENININRSDWFNVTVNVSCSNADCENINVTLDPSIDRTPRSCSQVWGASCRGDDPSTSLYSYDGCNSGAYYSQGFWVDETTVDATTIAIGDTLNITCTFDCYSHSPYNSLGISYYNGTWNRIWTQNSQCVDGNYSTTVTISGTIGTQKARCSIGYNNYATAGTCFSGTYSDNDDVNFSVIESGKGGTVSMNSSATPFYTNVTNPYNLSLNDGESQIITWWVNATGTSNSPYIFFVYANLTDNPSVGNMTSLWNVTITNGTLPVTDSVYPIFSNYLENNGIQQGLGIGYFNVTLTNTNGTVWLSINGTNYSATNISNVYSANYNFTSIGNYSYTWYAYGNGNLTNINNSVTRNYTVNLADTILPRVTINSPLNITYTTSLVDLSVSLNENGSWCGYSLDGNSNITITAINSTYFSLTNSEISQGSHAMVFSCNDSSGNFNSSSRAFSVDSVAPSISFASPENISYNSRNLLLNIETDSDARNVWFNRGLGNETYISAGSKTFNEGSNTIYAYVNDSAGNLNSTLVNLFIDSIAPSINVNSPEEKTYNLSVISFNISTSENSYCWIALNSTENYTMQTGDNLNFNYSLTLENGMYSINYYCNDSFNNLNQKTMLFGIDTVPPQISLNFPASGGRYSNSSVQFNYTPSASNGINTCELWGDWGGGWHKNQSSSSIDTGLENYFVQTLDDGNYIWNVWCNDTVLAEHNDWSTQGNISFSIDNTPPYVGFVFPAEISYNTSIITLELSNNSDASSIWWYNGSVNATYNSPIDFNLDDGEYNFIAYANDSAGNLNQTNISFNVDTSLPAFSDYSSNNASLIGEGIGSFNITIENTNGSVWLNINNNLITATNINANIYNASYNFSSEGIYEYYWVSYSNGTSHLLGNSETQEYTVNATDKISPDAVLLSPENNFYSNNSEINFTANLSDITLEIEDTESGIKNATLNIYNETGLVNKTTIVNSATGTLTQTVGIVVSLVNNVYTWFYSIFDFAGNEFVTGNNTLVVDRVAPSLTIDNPDSNSNSSDIGLAISYSASDSNLDSCWYDDEGYSTENILENCGNLTGALWMDGQHNVTIYARDSAGNINSTSLTFVIDSTPPATTLNSPEEDYSGDGQEVTEINFNCSATDANLLNNISLYLTNSLNEGFLLNDTKSITGTSNSSNWTIGLLYGNYTWNCLTSDSFGNNIFAENNRTLELAFTDSDRDHISDGIDNLIGNTLDVAKEGLTNFNITVSGNSTYGSYNDTQEIAFYDSSEKLVNFTFNFSSSKLELNKIRLIKDTNSIIINLSGQLQMEYSKTVYISDNNFVELCAKDTEINNISQITDDCTDMDETNFTSCLGNNTGVTKGYLTCVDEGDRIRIDGLRYSAIRGTPAVEETTTPVISAPSTSSGGGGGGVIIANKTKDECSNNNDCAANNYCFQNKCYAYECTNNSQCSDGKSCWGNRCVKLFDIKILEVGSPIDAGNLIHFTYFLKAMADINNDVIVDFWLEKDGKTISSGKDTIFIGNMEEKTENSKIFIPTGTEPGLYNFHVSVTYEKYSAESYRQIQIDKNGNILLSSNSALYYILPLLMLLIVLFSLIVIKLYKKKIKDWYKYEEEYVLTHKIAISILCICIISALIIFILGIFNIINLPPITDYGSSISLFIKDWIAPYFIFIILAVFSVALLYLFIRRKKTIHKDNYGEKYKAPRKNYLESGLKKIQNKIKQKIIQRTLHRRIRVLEKKGYDVDAIKKDKKSKEEQINEWKKKGYDVGSIKKNKQSKKEQIEEWKRKGFDVNSMRR